ncbi:MAG: carbohydrate kinase family protein [Candidatus Pacearchaeota archaeon]|jgi:ribokinase
MDFDVITFGSALVDIFVNTGLPEKKNDICYPAGSKIKITKTFTDIGGGGTNSAVAFSRLGLKTGCISCLGNDSYGKEILDLLKKEKVKFFGKVKKNAKTDFSIILDSKEKNRTILVNKKTNNEISFGNLNLRGIKTRWLYLSSSLGESFEAQKKLARELRNRGVKIAFNPSEYLIKEKDIRPLLKICDCLILNLEEAGLLTKEKDLLEGLYKLGPKIVVITNREKMVSCYDGKKKYFFKPGKVRVVENTGAGDAFASGFVAGQIMEKTIEESLKLGLKESESVISYFGAKNKLLKMKLK